MANSIIMRNVALGIEVESNVNHLIQLAKGMSATIITLLEGNSALLTSEMRQVIAEALQAVLDITAITKGSCPDIPARITELTRVVKPTITKIADAEDLDKVLTPEQLEAMFRKDSPES